MKLTNVETALSHQTQKQGRLKIEKSNLKFYDIDVNRDETPDDSERKVRYFIGNTLGVDCAEMPMERAHRIPSCSRTRPILVQFSHYKHRWWDNECLKPILAKYKTLGKFRA